jgi:hypothetical protein
VPVAEVEGAAPAPPPITIAFAVRAAEEAQPVALEKYGIPPDVPAIVKANVPLVVIGDPAIETIPPVNEAPTEVTPPPPPPVDAIVIVPGPFVIVMFAPAVRVAFASVFPVELPISN